MKRAADATHPRYQALLQLLRAADTLWNASRLFFAQWELSPSQFNVLNLLQLNPAGLSQTELSRELIMHRSNVTGLVDRLEQRGLVQRKDAAADRRVYRVVLTRAGAALLQEILPGYYQNAIRVWGEFPAGRITQLAADLAQLSHNAKQLTHQMSGTLDQECP